MLLCMVAEMIMNDTTQHKMVTIDYNLYLQAFYSF